MLTVRGISYLAARRPDDVRRDLEVIARELHCTTVMLIGGDGERLIDAARTALELGLAVYVRPTSPSMAQPKLLEQLDAVAGGRRAPARAPGSGDAPRRQRVLPHGARHRPRARGRSCD